MSNPESREARVLAVCVGRARDVLWQGQPLRTGIFKTPVDGPVDVHSTGLGGDEQADLTVHGGVDKAVYAYAEESADHWRQTLARPEIGPGSFGENLTLRGWPDADVAIGDRFRIGSVCLEVSQPRQPCQKLARRFEDAAFPKRFLASRRVGFYLRVIEPGRLAAGDAVVRVHHDPTSLDLPTLVGIWLGRKSDLSPHATAQLERAVALPALADAWRIPLAESLAARSGRAAGPR